MARRDTGDRRGDAGDGDRRDAPAPEADVRAAADATPSMAQYLEIKAANPDCILWYRMGDFYELFFEDAVVAADALGIVLTKRGKHLGEPIPMCGVPVVRADEYLQRLIRKGFRVAVCEQLEDPAEARKRGAKAVVRRDVVRLVTPGTLTEDALLDAKTRNYLTALFVAPQADGEPGPGYALASIDISTGEFEVGAIPAADLAGEIYRLDPRELVAPDTTLAREDVKLAISIVAAAATPVPALSFDALAGERLLKDRLGVADLAAFGAFTRAEFCAVAALLRYVELTQIGRQPVLRPPKRTSGSGILVIDASSRASLEILRSTSGDKAGSLLSAVDDTVTGPGARELAARLASPLRDPAAIAARLDAVSTLVETPRLRDDVRQALRRTPDIARAVSRLALQRGGPRDLGAVRDGLQQGRACAERLRAHAGVGLPAELARIARALAPDDAGLLQRLASALVDEPPHLKRDGNFVRDGFSAELDDVRRLGEDSRRVMAALESRYVEETGVKTLKVRHNNILGYFIEVTAQAAKPLLSPPLSASFRHRQTMANAVRFTTVELEDIETRIAEAGDRSEAIETRVFAELAAAVAGGERILCDLAAALADLDVYAGLAELAERENYTRPVVETGTAFEIVGGRHPVVEQALKRAKSGAFIENDCVLVRGSEPLAGFDESGAQGRLWLVTGPNMAGKSTYLRQNAIIALLAQAGSYVPARHARIGAVDRLFSRVGASDDLARGRSTFMVEMVETAAILNQATAQSLVILDEIGRGTATFDGLSIAWATVEFLHDTCRCRTLFATHYHELTALAARLSEVGCVTMDVREWQDGIVFLHKVKPGTADRSYGIQVAKLAGLPSQVIRRAGEVLRRLERSDRKGQAGAALAELPLFAAAPDPPRAPVGPSALQQAVDEALPDEMTPKTALEFVYKLKRLRAADP